jgi:hypothetical protein
MGERRGVYMVLVGKSEGKRPPGRSKHKWEDNITMDLQEEGGETWSGLIWLRIGTRGGHFCGNEHTDSITLEEFLDWLKTC